MDLLNECPTGGSHNCFWDAAAQGDGQGQSFIDIDGTAYNLDVPEGHYILEAYSNTASPTGYTVVYQEHNPAPVPGVDPILPIAIVSGAIVTSIVAIVTGYLKRA